LQIGLSICYDIRFPNLYRKLAQEGAEVIAIPAAFTKTTGMAHWHVLNRARAIENVAFVVSPCAAGKIPGGGESYGHSLIINPWGEIIKDGGENRGLITTSIDVSTVEKYRNQLPSLQHDKKFIIKGL
jgi:predicted amidohydrolase